MKTYLMLFVDSANIVTLPHLPRIRRDERGVFWLIDGDRENELRYSPMAVYRCPNEASALALLAWIDEYGEDGPPAPETYDWSIDWFRDADGNPTKEPTAEQLEYRAAKRNRPDGLLLFRNGAPRGPKGGAK